MCDAPIGTTRWITGQDWNGLKKLMYSGGRGGIVTNVNTTKGFICGVGIQTYAAHADWSLTLSNYKKIITMGADDITILA